MTKTKPSTTLKQLVDINKIKLEVEEWVERVGKGGGKEGQ